MTRKALLSEIERKAWLQTFEHGLWDIAIGLLWLSFGLSILTGIAWMTPIWVAVALPAMQQSMRRLIAPRIGHVTFRGRRRRSMSRVTAILTVTALLGLVFFLLTSWSTRSDAPAAIDWFRTHMLALIGLIWGGALGVAGWAADFPRLYTYGGILFGALLGADLGLPYNLAEALLGVGALITAAGLILLLRFLWRYPPLQESGTEGALEKRTGGDGSA